MKTIPRPEGARINFYRKNSGVFVDPTEKIFLFDSWWISKTRWYLNIVSTKYDSFVGPSGIFDATTIIPIEYSYMVIIVRSKFCICSVLNKESGEIM